MQGTAELATDQQTTVLDHTQIRRQDHHQRLISQRLDAQGNLNLDTVTLHIQTREREIILLQFGAIDQGEVHSAFCEERIQGLHTILLHILINSQLTAGLEGNDQRMLRIDIFGLVQELKPML